MDIRAKLTPPPRPLSLAVGNFDGFHLGHQAVAARAQEAARALDLLPAVMTFMPHPVQFFRPHAPPPLLFSLRDKLAALSAFSPVYVVKFNAAFAATSAADFEELLFGRLRARRVFTGEDFRYGQGRAGDCDSLSRAAKLRGAAVEVTPPVMVDGGVVSSSRARKLLGAGDLSGAKKLLGADWCFSARIMRGAGRGRRLGFATANLAIRRRLPIYGIFAAQVKIFGEEQWRAAALSVGTNPTFGGRAQSVEAHILNFDGGDLYGRLLAVRPARKIRDEEKYSSEEELKNAVAQDIQKTCEAFQ